MWAPYGKRFVHLKNIFWLNMNFSRFYLEHALIISFKYLLKKKKLQPVLGREKTTQENYILSDYMNITVTIQTNVTNYDCYHTFIVLFKLYPVNWAAVR